ncbi:MAG: DUF222 domain-containing protein [Acidimicrobiales bacterium]
MDEQVFDSTQGDPSGAAALFGAVERANAAVDDLFEHLDALEGRAVMDSIATVETLRRRVEAVGVAMAGRVDREGLFRIDGHRSAATSVAHRADTARAVGGRRRNAARTVAEMPAVRKWFEAGAIGVCHMARMTRAHSNERVRDALVSCDELFADAAREMNYRDFDFFVGDFERMVDQDGTCDRNERNHANRDVRLTQRPDLGWDLEGGFGAIQGACINKRFQAFIHAEACADWDAARAERGDAACEDHLPRTPGQRRADAFDAMTGAAAASAAAPPGVPTETTIVFDPETWERALGWFETGRTDPVDPSDAVDAARSRRHGCHTLDGVRLEPREAVAASLTGAIRRLLVDAAGVPLDRSRPVRLFTGAVRAAVQATATECLWPGCHRPGSECQIDHLRPFRDGGETHPANAGPMCGFHNRIKNHGYSTWRDADGKWHTARPDGTEIPP